jgi:tetratricopeptide (TPR) repeat protein
MPSLIRSLLERSGWWVAVVVGLLALAPLSARAQAQTGEARAQAQARAKFLEGNAAYEQSQYQKALDAYVEAYRLLPLPGFLFNIAQCYRQLDQPEQAATFYRRYLAQSKQPPANAPLVRELIAEMDAAAGKPRQKDSSLRKQTTEVAERRARQDSERSRTVASKSTPANTEVQGESLTKKWWVWAGAGAVAIAAGGIVYAATAPQPRPTTLGTIR